MSASAGKFKVGDKIRVTVDGWRSGNHNAQAGDVYVVNGVSNEGVHTNLFYFTFDEVELVPVAEATGTLTIQPGRYYKTRDGRKVGPMREAACYERWTDSAGRESAFIADDRDNDGIGGSYYASDGTWLTSDDDCNHHDLVAEWVDEPAVAPATAKFKVGDRVEVVGGIAGNKERFIGTFFTIDNDEGDLDGEQSWSGRDSNSPYRFRESELRLVAPATSGNVIVALIENGQPKPSHRPYVHASREAAETEAARLAGKHPGKEFGVYELVATKREAKVYDFEWQRLAAGGSKLLAVKELRRATGLGLATANDAVNDWLKREAA